jgi:cyclophilin family peptidyl-prolyl cis-trans isomerase
MIQGGCPLGTGNRKSRLPIDDEFHPELKQEQPGILSMANADQGQMEVSFLLLRLQHHG